MQARSRDSKQATLIEQSSGGRSREADLRAGHPEHFINHQVPGMLEVIENIGETSLPWRVFYRSLPDSAPFPQPWDGEFPVRSVPKSSTPRTPASAGRCASCDTPHGARFRITSSLAAAAPEELIDRHLHHMAIEYTNWARIARESAASDTV